MLVFLAFLLVGANAYTCASGAAPLLAAYSMMEFPCSKRSVESLVCPVGNACEFLEGRLLCCPYSNTSSTCNRYAASTDQCNSHTGCTVTKEYGCIETAAVTANLATSITTLPFITGTCWHRCGVAGWSSRTLGPPNANTACSCTTTCWQSNTCCVDYPFFCSYLKSQYARYPA